MPHHTCPIIILLHTMRTGELLLAAAAADDVGDDDALEVLWIIITCSTRRMNSWSESVNSHSSGMVVEHELLLRMLLS